MCNIKVNVDVNKYISPNLIFLDNPKTWPIESTNYLRDNKGIIKKYFAEDKRIEQGKANKNSKNYHKFVGMSNKYQDSFDEIKNNFMELLFDLKYKFVIYHATRLMDYEVDNIRRNGLKLSSKDFIKQKIDDLYQNKIISKNEYDIINEKNLLKSKEQIIKRENQIWAAIGSQDFRYIEGDNSVDPSGFYNLLYNYGGEIIYKGIINNKELLNKLRSNSKPYFIIILAESSMICDNIYTLGEKIIKFYFKKTDRINNDILCKDESEISILDIVSV